jgi:transposase
MIGTHVCTELMDLHLRWLSAQLGPDRHAVLVLDQAGWHVAKELKVPANITLHFLPPYSPELNPVERLWLWMREHLLSNRVYHDEKDLTTAGSAAFNSLTAERVRSVCRVSWLGPEK